ncbi:MAG: DUF1810 domain-containing protein [Pseudomonadota bacterium]
MLCLDRFVEAQTGVVERALAELRAGQKRSHWMWFVLPQLTGLGSSPMAQRYAIRDLEEAVAYLEHAVLGPRLLQAVTALQAHEVKLASAILGPVDARKYRSCLTLFEHAAEASGHDPAPFSRALDAFYAGERCGTTRQALLAG